MSSRSLGICASCSAKAASLSCQTLLWGFRYQVDEQNLRAFLSLRLRDLLIKHSSPQSWLRLKGDAHSVQCTVPWGGVCPSVSRCGKDDELSSENGYPSVHSKATQPGTTFPGTPCSVCGHVTTSHQWSAREMMPLLGYG